MLSFVIGKFQQTGLIGRNWESDYYERGRNVELFRDYVDGRHRDEMTREMRQLLRVQGDDINQMNLNLCDLIVRSMADRLTLARIETDNEAGNEWVSGLMRDNRIDAEQIGVHEGALRDGDAYVMVEYDADAGAVRMVYEPAWDGETGVIVVYDRWRRNIAAGAKVWYEGEVCYTRLYYPDRTEKYRESDVVEQADWRDANGQALGVPIVSFRHRQRAYDAYGNSELYDLIGQQDALNRIYKSMVMAGELTAFGIRVAQGFEPPAAITPGMWIQIGADAQTAEDVALLSQARAYMLEPPSLMPFIQNLETGIRNMSLKSGVALPMAADAGASGESLKQREVSLLSKVRRAQVNFGNSWEATFEIAHRVQAAYGVNPPAIAYYNAVWVDAQVRNDAQVIQQGQPLLAAGYNDEWLAYVAPVYGWTPEEVARIKADRAAAANERLSQLSLPGFGL